MTLYYIDTSAALKLLAEESHSCAFVKFYDESAGASWVSSALLRIEVIRAVSRVCRRRSRMQGRFCWPSTM